MIGGHLSPAGTNSPSTSFCRSLTLTCFAKFAFSALKKVSVFDPDVSSFNSSAESDDATPIFSNNFFKLVEGSEYRKPISAIDSADAIVVLSGMLEINEVGDSTYIE